MINTRVMTMRKLLIAALAGCCLVMPTALQAWDDDEFPPIVRWEELCEAGDAQSCADGGWEIDESADTSTMDFPTHSWEFCRAFKDKVGVYLNTANGHIRNISIIAYNGDVLSGGTPIPRYTQTQGRYYIDTVYNDNLTGSAMRFKFDNGRVTITVPNPMNPYSTLELPDTCAWVDYGPAT